MGRFVPATGVFPTVAKSTQLPDLLSAAYVDVIGSKWGIYRGQSHMPFGETHVKEFNWDGRRYEITIWPNDQQDIEVENRFLPVFTSRNSDEYNTAGTIVALGIFNYSVPWLDWYVRSHPRFTKRPWASNDVWTEVTMVERKRMSGDESVDYMEMTDKERLEHKEWIPKDDRVEKTMVQMMARLTEQQNEFANTNITYLTIRDMGSRLFPPLNWPYTPLRH